MRPRIVEFADDARADLFALYDWIAEAASPDIGLAYIERIERYCLDFDYASERGQLRDDIRPGLRVIGFERRITIAFMVEDERVVILRLFYAGRDWTEELQ